MSKDPTASAKSSGDNAMLLLDNPVWHSLSGPQQRFAELSLDGLARRFVPEVSPFSAVDQVNEESWAALAELVGPQKTAVLVRPRVPPAPEGWTELFRQPCHQMIARDLPAIPVLELLQLGTADTDEIMSLVELTEPGPFRPRTIELGAYVGVRQAGRLMAMAGQRLHLPGWREISAVVHPSRRPPPRPRCGADSVGRGPHPRARRGSSAPCPGDERERRPPIRGTRLRDPLHPRGRRQSLARRRELTELAREAVLSD